MKPIIRVASAQMSLRSFEDADALFERIAQCALGASEYGADFLCLPEHITLQTLSKKQGAFNAIEAVDALTELTDSYKDTLAYLASHHRVNIIGGSHLNRCDDGIVRNMCYVAQRDGVIDERPKIHPTPDERSVWGVLGGDDCDVIHTDCGPIGVAICYDSEFPELGRHLVDQDARIVFVPYLTDTEHGHWRVTHSCMARAIENQIYVVTAGLTGTIANVENLSMAFAASRIITPCDVCFSADGIAAQAHPGIEQLIVADLDMEKLDGARRHGAVQNLRDRRDDLYETMWKR